MSLLFYFQTWNLRSLPHIEHFYLQLFDSLRDKEE